MKPPAKAPGHGLAGIIRHQGKGAAPFMSTGGRAKAAAPASPQGLQDVLPNPKAMRALAAGDPGSSSINDYAKRTPLNNIQAQAMGKPITQLPSPAEPYGNV